MHAVLGCMGYQLVSRKSSLIFPGLFAFAVVNQPLCTLLGASAALLLQSSNTLVGSTSPLLTRWKSWWRANDAPELHCYIVVYFKY